MSLRWTDEKPPRDWWDEYNDSMRHQAVIAGMCPDCHGTAGGIYHVHGRPGSGESCGNVEWVCKTCRGNPKVIFDPLIHSTREAISS